MSVLHRSLALLALFAAPAGAQTAAPAPAPAAQIAPLYLLTYRAGPTWVAGEPMHRQKLRAHFLYMQQLLKDGHLVAGGPFTGEDGGMAIVRAASPAEASAILKADPAVVSGVFTATLTRWEPRIDSRQPLSR